MIKSLRGRLQLWYGLVLALAIGSFATLVYWRAERDTVRRAEEQVRAAARNLEMQLRAPPPPHGERPPLPRLEPWLPTPPRHRPGPPPPHDGPRGDGGGPHSPPPPERPDHERPDHHGPMLAYVVWGEDGSILTMSDGEDPADWQGWPPPFATPGEITLEHGPGQVRAITLGPRGATILAIRDLRHDISDVRWFGLQVAGFGAAVFAVGLAGGWVASGRIVRPISRISTTAAGISATNLGARIETQGIDRELVGLAETLNDTFARLEAAFARQTRFTADASHELRTPLAVIHSQIELALSQERGPDEYRATLDTCRRASSRMRSLIEGLLTLARADSGKLELDMQPADLRTIAREAVATFQEQAREAQINLTCQVPEQQVLVAADTVMLARVPANFIANALQHTPVGGEIRVVVEAANGGAVLKVSDAGCGIEAEHLPRLFERFYRVDTARSRSAGGCGLGLAICQCLAQSHGGTVSVSSQPGQGACFELRLPLYVKGLHLANM